ncbi:creatininase family protein [Bartonella sp. M0187]|uniref:creatininase family protein n=1 Tax=Bartonella apihabitans TaxID=2750929 RepID=UPI0018DC42BB|nr:creatininase family protein [Bartonella apihabitans]
MKKEDQIIAILPLGAHEYHGPHLSPTTDAVIAGAFAERLASLFPTAPKRLTPLEVESVGYSIEHKGRPFTKTLEYSQAIDRWISIGADCYKKGIKKILVLNAHGGNSPLMNIVITELRCRFKMLAVATSWGRFGLPEGLMTVEEKALDIHAGFIETSLMLYLAPDTVNMEKAQKFSNWQKKLQEKFKYLRAYGPFPFGWKMADINRLGAAGNALAANREAGKAIFDHAIEGFRGLVEDMFAFDIDELS